MIEYNNAISSTKQIQFMAIMTVISGIIFAASSLHITDPIGKIILFTTSPLLSTVNHIEVQVKNEITIIQEAHLLASKYRAAQEQNIELRAELAQAILIQEENKKLREQLGSAAVAQYKLIPARIIMRDRETSLVFDQNTEIQQGAVVVYKNNFVGRIKNYSSRNATMILATDPDSKIDVDVITSEKNTVRGTIYGQFGTSVRLDQVDQNAKIQKGDLVVLAKAAGLPEGVVVGEIGEVEKVESDLFQKALVSPFFEFDKVDTVFVIQ